MKITLTSMFVDGAAKAFVLSINIAIGGTMICPTGNSVRHKFLKPSHQLYDILCASAAAVIGDTLLLISSTHTKDFPLWMSMDPAEDSWAEAVNSFQVSAWGSGFVSG